MAPSCGRRRSEVSFFFFSLPPTDSGRQKIRRNGPPPFTAGKGYYSWREGKNFSLPPPFFPCN